MLIKRIVGALGILFIVIFAFFYLRIQLREWTLFRASDEWPDVVGKVTYSVAQYDSDGSSPYIVYEYRVEGHLYKHHTRVQFGSEYTSEAESLVAKYPAGSDVIIYYNPDNPNDSVLRKTFNVNWLHLGFWTIAATIVVLVVGAIAFDFIKRLYLKVSHPIQVKR